MSPDDANSLEWGDIVLYQGQLWRVAQVGLAGGCIRLIGHTMEPIIRPRGVELVYRVADIPPDTQLGHLTAEQEARILAIISARKAAETRKETR